jgi:parallel beta-helix repeat protein
VAGLLRFVRLSSQGSGPGLIVSFAEMRVCKCLWILVGVSLTSAVQVCNASKFRSPWNPSNLGVPWATDFRQIAANEINVRTDWRMHGKAKGDGVTDDTSAITDAIRIASSSGGGVVYFPAGDYEITTRSDPTKGTPLLVPSGVILRGSGSTKSRIFVNDPSAESETDFIATWGGIDFRGSSMAGMTDLGVYAVNSSASPCALLWNRGPAHVRELFFNNLDIHLANCRPFWFQTIDKLLIKNVVFQSDGTRNGPVYVVNNSNIAFLNNQIMYHYGRVQLQNNTNLLMQGNHLLRNAEGRDMGSGTAIESGGVELSFGEGIQVLNNKIETLNAPAGEREDGEAITTQNSNAQDLLDVGNVGSVTDTTLTDSRALWGPISVSRLAKYPEVVVILTGNGTGQWRSIEGIDAGTKTLTVRQRWSPVPDVGSLYSILVWTLSNAIIQGNTLINNPNGIVLWDGCYNCIVQDNTLLNSRGILLRTVDEVVNPSLYSEVRRVHEVALDTRIVNNVVSNSSGLRPAYVALDAEAFASDVYRGLGMMNIRIEGNSIKSYAGEPSRIYDQRHNQIPQDGFFPCILFGPATFKDSIAKVFRNINFKGNSETRGVTYTQAFLPYTTMSCVAASSPN